MLPTQKTPPKLAINDLTILVYGAQKLGKCLSASAMIVDPNSGRRLPICDLVAHQDGDVLTMKEASVIASQRPSAYIENPPQQLYRLTTQTGRCIEATANHPFLTRDGWKPLSDLVPAADRVAVVVEYPDVFGKGDTDDELIKILAYLIADGSLAGGSSPVFTKSDPEVRFDFEAAVEAKGDECVEFVNEAGVTHVRVRGKQGSRNNVIAYLREVGIDGLRSAEKYIPEFVFGLKKHKIKLFLNRLFTCDGSMEAQGRVSYSSTSIRMVREVQHLLARFGIVSLIHDRYRDGELYGAELIISSKANVLRFIDQIGFYGEKAVRAEAVRAQLYSVREAETQLDRLGPILFDRIRSIEATVVAPVYDLTVEGTHNFVADDFVVHNSSFCSQADSALFLATEAGLNSIEAFQVPIGTWEELLAACKEIAEGKHAFKTIIIDTVDNAYRMCADYICAKFKVEHESDLSFGKGFALINAEFFRVLNKLALLPYGLILVSHSQEKEIETRTGKLTRIVPTLPEKARKIVLGMVDLILYCDIEMATGPDGKAAPRRVIRTKPNVNFEAGDRTGRLPEVIDLDFGKFLQAFAAGRPATPPPAAPPASPPAPAPAAQPAAATGTGQQAKPRATTAAAR